MRHASPSSGHAPAPIVDPADWTARALERDVSWGAAQRVAER
jgi:hypothetical protein